MSGIPSDIAGSALQAGMQARNVNRTRDAERTGQAHAADRTAPRRWMRPAARLRPLTTTPQIYADAEGTGSQGRAYEDELLENADDEQQLDEGITRSDDGRIHLDIEA